MIIAQSPSSTMLIIIIPLTLTSAAVLSVTSMINSGLDIPCGGLLIRLTIFVSTVAPRLSMFEIKTYFFPSLSKVSSIPE